VGMDVEREVKKSDPNVGTVVAYQKGDILLSKKGNGNIIMSKHKSYKNIIF
jgi:hypothetical protein